MASPCGAWLGSPRQCPTHPAPGARPVNLSPLSAISDAPLPLSDFATSSSPPKLRTSDRPHSRELRRPPPLVMQTSRHASTRRPSPSSPTLDGERAACMRASAAPHPFPPPTVAVQYHPMRPSPLSPCSSARAAPIDVELTALQTPSLRSSSCHALQPCHLHPLASSPSLARAHTSTLPHRGPPFTDTFAGTAPPFLRAASATIAPPRHLHFVGAPHRLAGEDAPPCHSRAQPSSSRHLTGRACATASPPVGHPSSPPAHPPDDTHRYLLFHHVPPSWLVGLVLRCRSRSTTSIAAVGCGSGGSDLTQSVDPVPSCLYPM